MSYRNLQRLGRESDNFRWSSKFGDHPAGDPELHHVVGSIYADEHETYEAERHLVIGTKDSAEVLAKMEYEWYKEGDAHLAPHFAGRAVLPYLLVGNVRAANASYRLFTTALRSDNPSLGSENVSTSACEMAVFPSLPLLNFLGMLLLTVQRGAPEMFKTLLSKYASAVEQAEGWSEPLEMIAEMYFGIQKPRQSNPLMDMMSNLFSGAGAPGGQQQQRRPGLTGAGLD